MTLKLQWALETPGNHLRVPSACTPLCSKSIISFFLFSPQIPKNLFHILISAKDLGSYLTEKIEAIRKELSPHHIRYLYLYHMLCLLTCYTRWTFHAPSKANLSTLVPDPILSHLLKDIPPTNLPSLSINFSFSTGAFQLANENAISLIVKKQNSSVYPTGTVSSFLIILQRNFLKVSTHSDKAFFFLSHLQQAVTKVTKNNHIEHPSVSSSFWAHLTWPISFIWSGWSLMYFLHLPPWTPHFWLSFCFTDTPFWSPLLVPPVLPDLVPLVHPWPPSLLFLHSFHLVNSSSFLALNATNMLMTFKFISLEQILLSNSRLLHLTTYSMSPPWNLVDICKHQSMWLWGSLDYLHFTTLQPSSYTSCPSPLGGSLFPACVKQFPPQEHHHSSLHLHAYSVPTSDC